MMKILLKYFRGLSLKKQFILIFLSTTVTTLVVSVIVLKYQITNIRTATDAQLNQLNNHDYIRDTTLTANTLRNGLLSYIFAISQILEQLQLTYTYYSQNPQSYASSQSASPLKLTTSCTATPNTSAPALYLFDPTNPSRYEQYSYFDVILPYLMVEKPNNFKRINIMFITLSNPNNTVIRTFPATSNFSTNNSNLFLGLASQSIPGYVTLAPPYLDPFTQSNLILSSLFTKIPTSDPNLVIVLQVELIISSLEEFFTYIIYFPNAVIAYTITNPYTNKTTVLSISNSTLKAYMDITTVMQSNQSTLNIAGTSYLVGISKMPGVFPINNLTATLASTAGPFSVLVLSPINDMDLPSRTLISFLDQYGEVSDMMFGICSAMAVMAVISFSYIAANLITFPLGRLCQGIKKFLSGDDSTKVVVMLNEFKCDKQLRCLIKNATAIFERVEGEVERHQGENLEQETYEFPENPCDQEFLKLMRSPALRLWEPIEEKLSQRATH